MSDWTFRVAKQLDGSRLHLVYGPDDQYLGHVEQPLGGWAFYNEDGVLIAVASDRDAAVRLGTQPR